MYAVYMTYALDFGILGFFSAFVILDYKRSIRILNEVLKDDEKT